tara:strand:- start:1651 stop:2154 length:504 start_codon:yes stop_codon:yes gene_type:complete
MSKESIDTISNTIFEYKENLDSADYKLVMDELGKLNAQEPADIVRLKVLKQNLVLTKNSESLDSYSMVSNVEERYFPLKMFRNHYGTQRDDYIANFEDIKNRIGKVIHFDGKETTTSKRLITLIDQEKESELFFVCTDRAGCDNQNCDCKCFDIYYDKYILLDCEIV